MRVLGHRHLAAGNLLGRRPGLSVAIETAPGVACDPEAVASLLAALAPDLEDEFQLVRVRGDAAPVPRAFAAVMVALLAESADLSARIRRLPSARPRWTVMVENGIVLQPAAMLDLAVDLVLGAVAGGPPDPGIERRLVALCGTADYRFGQLERAMLIRRIEQRGHVWRGGTHGPVGVIGEGRRRVVLRHSITMRTMNPGAVIGERKDATLRRLARAGLPVPRQVRVADAAAARAAAAAIGYPVVVKPLDRSNARGVAIGLTTADAVGAAYAAARACSDHVCVESQLPGQAFRLLTLEGQLVAAVVSTPGRFVGDGRRSLRELVDEANRIPRRQRPRPIQRPIAWTPEILEYLAERGQGPDRVPAAGSVVFLHWSEQGRQGGSILAVDGAIHPDNRKAACQAADLIGIDFCGIDMVLPDIARSWRETGGGICEVNRSPGLRYHLVADGADTPVLGRYLDYLLDRPGLPGAGSPRRIPILLFLGGEEMEGPALATAAMLERQALAVGLATTGRFVAAGLPLVDPGVGAPQRIQRLVDDPAVGAVVAVVPSASILEFGLGHDRADLAVVDPSASEPAGAAARLLASIGARLLPPADLADGQAAAWILARHRAGHHRAGGQHAGS